ncbi:hypothetical protein L3X38_044168 [Prunus dulcis]|uniref:Uncharacterized protein n=1 Tax=Prunus dulcis TaxID=3755 RepID=A0AAD4YLY2_PRUDU|nr:hypothetical protein L3X38_044168 [Prunus dulcis]
MDADAKDEGYKLPPDFQENTKEALVDFTVTDSTELWLIDLPKDQCLRSHRNSEVKRVPARAIPGWVTHWEVARDSQKQNREGREKSPKRTILCYSGIDPET